MAIRGTATFIQRGGYIFRVEAKLSFGNGSGPDILAIGLNPGSCQLEDPYEWEVLEGLENQKITGKIKLDRTMNHMKEIILEADPSFQGTIRIYNLINYRNGNLSEALTIYKQMKQRQEFLFELETDFANLLQRDVCSFIWLGWSYEKNSMLNRRKQQVMDDIIRSQKPIIAKYHNDKPFNVHVGHFSPQLVSKAKEYRSYIVPQIRSALNFK
ncbi:hypothetical protein ACTHSJ_26240 [Paenibacillus cellulositrophicus]|uniref:hypothetical protein n=1 Tax=Paenibacillus cellulositrophicus TaxID=562959 RepID=UPI00203EEE1E|nr:hypothetical protein [Paenibacillus cellulositrophicus]MCM3001282.1 hypothetical protein [Paenibacillus cellulositrophicus]